MYSHNVIQYLGLTFTGFASDPVPDEKVNITHSDKTIVVSIAQDLIYAESKERIQTLTSLAFGMKVRERTGSIRLLKILHGLRHTASTATVFKHDKALVIASMQDDVDEMKIHLHLPRLFGTIITSMKKNSTKRHNACC